MNTVIEVMYNHILVRGDIIEAYARTIENKGMWNFLFEKNFKVTSENKSSGIGGYYSSKMMEVAKRIMDAGGEIISSRMESKPRFYQNPSYMITLEKISANETKVIIEGPTSLVKKLNESLDEIFLRPTFEEFAIAHAMAPILNYSQRNGSSNFLE
jgi:hypothetical protein